MPADLVPAFTMGNQIELGEFFVDDTNHRTALQNQKLFLKKYSIDIQLPSSYVLDA